MFKRSLFLLCLVSFALLTQNTQSFNLLKRLRVDIDDGKAGLNFIIGFIEGFINENASQIEHCEADAIRIGKGSMDVINGFKNQDIGGYIQGLTGVINLVLTVPQQLENCKEVQPIVKLLKVKVERFHDYVKIGQSIMSMAIFHNGDFVREIVTPIEDFQKGMHKEAGKAIGKLLDDITK
eukprot:403368028